MLPTQKPGQKSKEDNKESTVRKGLDRAGTWMGQTPKKPGQENAETKPGESSAAAGTEGAVRQGLSRMGTWGFGGGSKAVPPEKEQEEEAEDDRRIRFTIGGAGRRLTKDDFLKEIQSLDPKARSEILESSDAPAAMKDMARKDASRNSPGSSRLFEAKAVQAAAGPREAKGVGAEMARRRGADVRSDEDDSEEAGSSSSSQTRERKPKTGARSNLTQTAPLSSRHLPKVETPPHDEPETAAERRRREGALKGVAERKPAQESRGRSPVDETPAEKRRREAALSSIGAHEEDSDDDNTPRRPAPKSRGIRFAQSPVRGRK